MSRLQPLHGIILMVTISCGAVVAQSGDPLSVPTAMVWDVSSLQQARPAPVWLQQDGPVHALTYPGEPYQGHATRVFAYYASPATLEDASRKPPFPGIVLVHGGGGKAFSDWVRVWAEHGYAAIAMDLAGCGGDGQPLSDGGPGQGDETKFGAIDAPVTDQWPYHAVADVILAHSLLRTFDEVDPDRTAVTGISWGGYLTCIVAGLDQRFKLAMPVYGCGFLHENSVWVATQFDRMTPQQRTKWVELWDPSRYLGRATMPLVFLNGTNDFAYPMDSYAKTGRLVQGTKHFSIRSPMDHGHIFDFPEFFLFADQYLQGGTPLATVATPQVADGRVRATVNHSRPLVSANLHYTTGPHRDNPHRKWISQPLEIHDHQVSGTAPPEDATAWYVDVRDDRQAITSSEPMIREDR